MNGKQPIHTPDYEGPDRRNSVGRRPADLIAANLKFVAAVISIVLIIFTVATAWTTSQRVLAGKVDREEWEARNVAIDKQLQLMANRQDRFEEIILQDVLPQLKKMDARLAAIYCSGKPPGCQ